MNKYELSVLSFLIRALCVNESKEAKLAIKKYFIDFSDSVLYTKCFKMIMGEIEPNDSIKKMMKSAKENYKTHQELKRRRK